jgi:L-asparaginase II
MINHPDLVAGTGRTCTTIMTNVPNVIVKTGAEGVYAAVLPERQLGLALKVDDGAGRAASVALLALLAALQALDEKARRALSALARPRLHNHAGRPIGRLEPAADWPGLIG